MAGGRSTGSVDTYCADHGLPVLSLASAQAFVFAASPPAVAG